MGGSSIFDRYIHGLDDARWVAFCLVVTGYTKGAAGAGMALLVAVE